MWFSADTNHNIKNGLIKINILISLLFSDIRKTWLIKFDQYRGDYNLIVIWYDSNNPFIDASFDAIKIIFLDILILILWNQSYERQERTTAIFLSFVHRFYEIKSKISSKLSFYIHIS